ncbi:MAG TPA: hypothetical protein VFL83_19220 [Anaeromyxobacter sp.]|nr:hypothetical protein [Anaeromyxobacter sp.]
MKHLKVILLAALVSAPFASRAQEAQKVQLDPGAWLVMSGFNNAGAFDARELPRFVFPEAQNVDQKASGWAVRQSRLRFGLTVPTDAYLAGSSIKGLVEVDFMGGSPSAVGSNATVDPQIIRLRHVYFAANWKQASNLTLTVGQTWGVAFTTNFAQSLANLALPRFGGGGFLFRRAPQLRLAADVPAGPVTLAIAGGVLSPGDLASQASSSAGNESAVPNFEGRVAAKVGAMGPVKSFELGLGVHYGQERYQTAATSVADVTATSQLFALDGKIDFGIVNLIGGIWQGQNLDVYNSIAGLTNVSGSTSQGVLIDTSVAADPKTFEMETQGVYLQLGVVPVKGLTLLLGGGFENPKDSTLKLPTSTTWAANTIFRNTQYNAAVIWSVSSRWRVSLEATRFITLQGLASGASDTLTGNQFQVGSILSI